MTVVAPVAPAVVADRFTQWLDFAWRPDMDGQAYHSTAGDNGGPTEWGFTFSTYTGWCVMHGLPYPTLADFKALSKASFVPLARALFWNAVQADHLPPGVGLLVCDFGFGSGPSTSVKQLQTVLGFTGPAIDGALGPVTLGAVARTDRVKLVQALGARHAAFYRSLGTFHLFGNGWLRRNTDRVTVALAG